MKDIIVRHRYFIIDKQNKYMYFGTAIHVGDGIKTISAPVNIYNSTFILAGLLKRYFYSYNFYIYIPYKMEEIMVTKF